MEHRTVAVTGAASGIGAATAARFRADGHRVISVDLRDADVVADLGTPEGRRDAISGIGERCDGLDAVVTCAGLGGLPDRPGSLIASVNYFGTVDVVEGLRPLLRDGGAAVVVSSNSATCQPGLPRALVAACLEGDEGAARAAFDAADWSAAYAASKLALAAWVRREAPTTAWIGAGVRLNAVAPGAVETPLLAETRADAVLGPLLDAFPIPAGAPARPDDIAAAITFLAGPDAAFCCGTVLFADGGTDAQLRGADWPAAWHPAG